MVHYNPKYLILYMPWGGGQVFLDYEGFRFTIPC